MDPTLAALCGALLGAVATAVVPVLTTRASRRDQQDQRRRTETVALLDACVRMLHARARADQTLYLATHAEGLIALERLLLTAPRRDVDHLQQVTGFAFESVRGENNLALASAGVEAMAQILRRWCRGELRGEQIADAYGPALDTQLDRHESRSHR